MAIAPTIDKKGHCIEPRKYWCKEYKRSHSNRYLQNQLKYALFYFAFDAVQISVTCLHREFFFYRSINKTAKYSEICSIRANRYTNPPPVIQLNEI